MNYLKYWSRFIVQRSQFIKNTSTWAIQSVQRMTRSDWRLASFWSTFSTFVWWKHHQNDRNDDEKSPFKLEKDDSRSGHVSQNCLQHFNYCFGYEMCCSMIYSKGAKFPHQSFKNESQVVWFLQLSSTENSF